MASVNEQPTKSARRWLRYSLRSLMLLVVAIAVPMAWKVNRARNQRVVVAELQKMGAQIIYDYEIVNGIHDHNLPPPGSKWLIELFGKEYFVEVYSLWVGGRLVTDETLATIARLPEIKGVTISSAPKATDGGLAHFAGMHNLEGLTLFSEQMTGSGLEHLTGLKRLKKLWASGWITDASLEHVSKLERLEFLNIDGVAQITDKGLAPIAKLTNLRDLRLGSDVQRDYMTIADEGLVNLYGLKNLGSLNLSTSEVTQAGIDNLKKVLPNCRIKWNPKDPSDKR